MHIGKYLEQQAETHLIQHGLKPIHRNFYCRQGEIDLIMLDHGQFVFTEVRGRSDTTFGTAHETISKHKQTKILHTAGYYIKKYPAAINCRFDIVTFLIERKRSIISIKKIEWLKNAIHVDGWAW